MKPGYFWCALSRRLGWTRQQYPECEPIYDDRPPTSGRVNWRLLPKWVSGLLLAATAGQPCMATQIWLAGGVDPSRWHKPDFLDLFQQDAQWSDVAGSISVFKTTNSFILQAPEDQVRLMIEWLQRRHIALAVDVGLLNGAGSGCGKGIEGFAMPRMPTAVAERVKRLGGSLAYIAMDEPLWFGRYATKKGACHWEIGSVLQKHTERSSP
jgi:hypothetical protein